MIRVVLDTNVLVSALLKPDSVPDLILSLVLSGEIILCLSEPIAFEGGIDKSKIECVENDGILQCVIKDYKPSQHAEVVVTFGCVD